LGKRDTDERYCADSLTKWRAKRCVAVITVTPPPTALEIAVIFGRGDTAVIVMGLLYSKP
jgi:hypothetical protein